jgi:hypothetical protein
LIEQKGNFSTEKIIKKIFLGAFFNCGIGDMIRGERYTIGVVLLSIRERFTIGVILLSIRERFTIGVIL